MLVALQLEPSVVYLKREYRFKMALENTLARPIFSEDKEVAIQPPANELTQGRSFTLRLKDLTTLLTNHPKIAIGLPAFLAVYGASIGCFLYVVNARVSNDDWKARTSMPSRLVKAPGDNRSWIDMATNPALLRNGRLLCYTTKDIYGCQDRIDQRLSALSSGNTKPSAPSVDQSPQKASDAYVFRFPTKPQEGIRISE
jgi:hypothetical protein